MNNYLGYDVYFKEFKEYDNCWNGYGIKMFKISFGEVVIDVFRDWEVFFELELIFKRKWDVFDIEGKVFFMYVWGMS